LKGKTEQVLLIVPTEVFNELLAKGYQSPWKRLRKKNVPEYHTVLKVIETN